MARPLRIQYPGALYHLTARGNGGQKIFQDKLDYQIFLNELKKTIENNNWLSYAYCLMPNHYHLFIKTLEPNLSAGMRQLNGNFTQKSNIRHQCYGHLFQGRFKSVLVESAGYQGNVVRYITLNPVKVKLVKSLSQWPWSSHREIMGQSKATGCVHSNETLALFGKNKIAAKQEYSRFLKEKRDLEETWRDLHSGLILGSLEFVREVIDKYGNKEAKENIKKERFAGRPKIEDLFSKSKNRRQRNELMLKAYKKYGYTQTEIGKHLGLHYSTVSRIIAGRLAG